MAPRLTQPRELPPRIGTPRLTAPAANKNPDFGRTLVGIPAVDLPRRAPAPVRSHVDRRLIELSAKAVVSSGVVTAEAPVPPPVTSPAEAQVGPAVDANATGEGGDADASSSGEAFPETGLPWYRRSSGEVKAHFPAPPSRAKKVLALLGGFSAAVAISVGVFGLAGTEGEGSLSPVPVALPAPAEVRGRASAPRTTRVASTATPPVVAPQLAATPRPEPLPPVSAAAVPPAPSTDSKPKVVSSSAHPGEDRAAPASPPGESRGRRRTRAASEPAAAVQRAAGVEAPGDDEKTVASPSGLQRAAFNDHAAHAGPPAASATRTKAGVQKRSAANLDADAPMPLGTL